MTRLNRLALRANGTAVVQTPAALVRVRAPYLKKPAYDGFFAFGDTPSSILSCSSVKSSISTSYKLILNLHLS